MRVSFQGIYSDRPGTGTLAHKLSFVCRTRKKRKVEKYVMYKCRQKRCGLRLKTAGKSTWVGGNREQNRIGNRIRTRSNVRLGNRLSVVIFSVVYPLYLQAQTSYVWGERVQYGYTYHTVRRKGTRSI